MAPPRRGFLFGDGGFSSIARACHHRRALVTPAARPGHRRVTIPALVVIVVVILLLRLQGSGSDQEQR